ncbi:MAG: hypothetical protein OXF54_12050 [Caldilineaceae bacterium]|nr:hypothetical protein [Caldilineaceae bacterium]
MTERSEDRLDRIERILERSAKEHAERFSHIERMFANAAEQFNRNEERFNRNEERFTRYEERFGRNEERFTRYEDLFNRNEERFAALGERLDQLSHDIGFLYAAVMGHVSQPTPPAHQD